MRIVDAVPPGASLLDVGAGHGLFARLAADRGARVTAVEPDVRKMGPVDDVRMVTGFDECIRGAFDVVSLVDVLYKVPLAEWDAMLARLAERVGEGGMLLIKEQDPTARVKNAWNRWQEALVAKLGLTLGEAFTYEAPEMFRARLARHGFTTVQVRRIDFGYPHPHVLYLARRG